MSGFPSKNVQELQGVPEKINSYCLLYISVVKKATKLMLILLERGIPPARFEYRTTSEQYIVTEICKTEVTKPRNGKHIFRKYTRLLKVEYLLNKR